MSFAQSHQDWGGRKRTNPDNAPKISRKQVEELAQQLDVQIYRDGSTWFALRKSNSTYYTIGSTNYLAYMTLKDQTSWIFS